MTGAFLADWAEVVDNKLEVRGGVLSAVTLGADRSVQFVVVVLTHAEDVAASPAGRHAKSHDAEQHSIVEVEITQPGGSIGQVGLELPEDLNDSEVGCAFFPLELHLPVDGRHEITLTYQRVRIPLPLTVSG